MWEENSVAARVRVDWGSDGDMYHDPNLCLRLVDETIAVFAFINHRAEFPPFFNIEEEGYQTLQSR